MTDGYFEETGYFFGEKTEVFQAQIMARVETQTQFMGFQGCFYEVSYGCVGVVGVMGGVGFGVELDAVGAHGFSPFHHPLVGINEDGHPDAVGFEGVDQPAQVVGVADGIPTGTRRDGVGRVGHERDLGGFHAAHQINEPVVGVAFDVEFRRDHLVQIQHVLVANVPLVGPGMDGDTLSAKAFAVQRHLYQVWVVATPRISDRGNLIDIDRQASHSTVCSGEQHAVCSTDSW